MLAAAALAGCNDDDQSEPPSEGGASLTISLDADGPGGEQASEALVRCRDSEAIPTRAACEAVDELPADPAAPTPPDVACTEIYGGPDVARVEGTLDGEPIETELTRENGCEIERFDRWTPVLRALFPGYRPAEALAG